MKQRPPHVFDDPIDPELAAAISASPGERFAVNAVFQSRVDPEELAELGLFTAGGGADELAYGELDEPAIARLAAHSMISVIRLVPVLPERPQLPQPSPPAALAKLDPALAHSLEQQPGGSFNVVVTFDPMPSPAELQGLGLTPVAGQSMATATLSAQALHALIARDDVVGVQERKPPRIS